MRKSSSRIQPTSTILRTTINGCDPWHWRTVEVAWIPEEVTGYDAGLANRGLREFAHATVDDPPVYLVEHEMSRQLMLRHVITQWAGTTEIVTDFRRVQSLDELEPGTFFIERDTDDE